MTGLKLTLLGGFEARRASGATVELPARKAQALLAYLGSRPGQRHRRDRLAALLWGDRGDDQARDGLRHALVVLRRALAGPDIASLQVEGQTLALDPAGVEVDVVTFERRVAEGTPPALEHAAEIYRGELLLGFSVNEPLFEEWLVTERARLRELALDAMTRLLAHQATTKRPERAIQTALWLLALDPLQETVHRTLMRLYARQRRRGAALKQYRACVGVLQRELGTEPEAETTNLYQELRRHPAGLPAPASRAAPAARGRTVAATPPDLAGADTPLVGRREELGRLRQALEAARRGHGHVATVVGEAGIGKTRLVSALAADALPLDCRVLIGRCHESDSILPFGPWVDACRAGALNADEEILGALLPARRAELTRLFPEARVPGLPRASDSALPLFESVAELIAEAAVRQPLVLVLEDLHWADEMSLRLLAFVSRRIAAWPVLLITTARHEEIDETSLARRTTEDVSRASPTTPVVLAPLSRADTTALVRALTPMGRDAPTAHLEEQVWAMSEGNPFVVVEAMRALDRDGGSDDPREPAGALPLPATVRDLVARRLDRLSARSQTLLAVAAVIGRGFDFTLLRVASGMDEQAAAEAVEELVRHHVLRMVGSQLDFTHDRIRDVADGRLLPPRRRVLHRAVTGALEMVGAGTAGARAMASSDGLGDRIEQLAHHALRGDLQEKAVDYLHRAGLKAAARSALPEARAWLEQALGLLEALPESGAMLERAFEIRLDLRPVLHQLGDVRGRLARLREAGALAERLNDDGRRGRVAAALANVHSQLGELDDALAAGARALDIAARVGDLRLRILTTALLEIAHFYRGDFRRAAALAVDNLAACPPDMGHEYFEVGAPPSVWDRSWLIMSLAQLGRFAEADPYEAAAIRLAESTDHAFTIGLAHYTAGTRHLLQGNWARAASLMARSIAVAGTAGVPLLLPYVVPSSAWALAQLDDASEALDRLREGTALVDRAVARGLVGHLSWSYHALGRAWLRLGRLDEALPLAHRALELASDHPGLAAHALHLLGDLASHPDGADAECGLARYREAAALADPRGMRPLVAHCHLGLGTLHARARDDAEAHQDFTTAARMYREMGMRLWLEQAESALKIGGRG